MSMRVLTSSLRFCVFCIGTLYLYGYVRVCVCGFYLRILQGIFKKSLSFVMLKGKVTFKNDARWDGGWGCVCGHGGGVGVEEVSTPRANNNIVNTVWEARATWRTNNGGPRCTRGNYCYANGSEIELNFKESWLTKFAVGQKDSPRATRRLFSHFDKSGIKFSKLLSNATGWENLLIVCQWSEMHDELTQIAWGEAWMAHSSGSRSPSSNYQPTCNPSFRVFVASSGLAKALSIVILFRLSVVGSYCRCLTGLVIFDTRAFNNSLWSSQVICCE